MNEMVLSLKLKYRHIVTLMDILMSQDKLIHHLNNLRLVRDIHYNIEYSEIISDSDLSELE